MIVIPLNLELWQEIRRHLTTMPRCFEVEGTQGLSVTD